MSRNREIPKIIHQMWLDENDYFFRGLPKKYEKLGYVRSWKEKNPEFEYKLWNYQDVFQLMSGIGLQKLLTFWLQLDEWIEKCDFARYLIMYLEGGVYVDLDFECLKNITPLLQNRRLGLVWEPPEHSCSFIPKEKTKLINGFMISAPKMRFWRMWISSIRFRYHAKGERLDPLIPLSRVSFTTGPNAFADFVKREPFFTSRHQDRYFIPTELIIPMCSPKAFLFRPWSKKPIRTSEKQNGNAYATTNWRDGTDWWKSNFLINLSQRVEFIYFIMAILSFDMIRKYFIRRTEKERLY